MTVIYFDAGADGEVFDVHCEVCHKACDRISPACLVWLSRNGMPIICEDCDLGQWQFLPPVQLLVKPGEFLHIHNEDKDPLKELVLEAGPSVGLGSEYCVPRVNGVKK